MESGGTRNYEVYKDKEKTNEELALEKEKGEKEDPMKALENRVLDSQREMADLDNLEEIRAMNRKHYKLMSSTGGGGFDAKAVLKALDDKIQEEAVNDGDGEQEELNEHGITEEEEKLVQSIRFGKKSKQQGGEIYGGGEGRDRKLAAPMRLSVEDEKREEEKRKKDIELIQQRQKELDDRNKKKATMVVPIKIKVKRKKIISATNDTTTKKKKQKKIITSSTTTTTPGPSTTAPTTTTNTSKENGLASLLGDYGSSSDSD